MTANLKYTYKKTHTNDGIKYFKFVTFHYDKEIGRITEVEVIQNKPF